MAVPLRYLVACLAVWAAARPVAADSLEEIRKRGTLRWGADQEGGGPFVFPRDDDPDRVHGFEVEIADRLAEALGVRPEFTQGQWDKLPELMDRGDIDIVLNGYEWTPNRAARYGTSIPYYIYALQLLGRREDATLASWDDLRHRGDRPRKRVAALGGSAAHTYLKEHFGVDVEVVSFDGATDAMRAVELAIDGVDANLQDAPVAQFYAEAFPGLRAVGEPVGMGYWVVLVRRGDERLLRAINDAIANMLRDGTLRRILDRYGMWNATQARRALESDQSGNFTGSGHGESEVEQQPRESFTATRGWAVIRSRLPMLLQAAWITIQLSVLAMPLAILIGLLTAIGRLYGPRLVAGVLGCYVELVRGTPLILQLYVIFFLLPEIGLSIQAFWAAILGLAINYSAYEAEIYRAGLQAIPRGQMEAAIALGMSRGLAVRRIIVPQATRIVIPAVTNDFIALFKDTAACSVITVAELSKEYYMHAYSTGAIVELGAVTALLYLAMSYPLSLLAGYLERRLHAERRT